MTKLNFVVNTKVSREFYVDIFSVLNHGFLCYIKIVIKITNGLTAIGGSVWWAVLFSLENGGGLCWFLVEHRSALFVVCK